MKEYKGVYQRKDGRWEARYRKGINEKGKTLYGSIYGATQDEVIEKREKVLTEILEKKKYATRLNLLILGAGAHGKDVKNLAESLRVFYKVSLLDDFISDEEIIGECRDAKKFRTEYTCAFVAIGDSTIRRKYIKMLKEDNYLIPNLISPYANISKNAIIGEGVVIMPYATVNDATIGDFCILASNSIINTNVVVGAYTHIDCGGIIPRNCVVPQDTWVNIGEVYQEN